MRFARGPEWVVLTWDFVEYVLHGLREKHSPVHAIWQDALLLYQPDESFFQTVIMNSPFCHLHVSRPLHYIASLLQEKKSHGSHDEIGTKSPAYLHQTDLQGLLASNRDEGARFFARKFNNLSEPASAKLRRQLDAAFARRRRPHMPINAWPGLEDWLAAHVESWMRVAHRVQDLGRAPGALDQLRCATSGAPNRTADSCAAQRLGEEPAKAGRLPAVRAGTEDAAVELRHAPASWVLRWGGAQATLTERFAVAPPRRRGAAVERDALLLALRVGSGWSAKGQRLQGQVGVLPSVDSAHGGPVLVAYWACTGGCAVEHGALRVRAAWAGPAGSECTTAEEPLSAAHLAGRPLALRLPDACARSAGEWRVRLELLHGGAGAARLELGHRDFVLYSKMEDVSVAQMQTFFELSFDSKGAS